MKKKLQKRLDWGFEITDSDRTEEQMDIWIKDRNKLIDERIEINISKITLLESQISFKEGRKTEHDAFDHFKSSLDQQIQSHKKKLEKLLILMRIWRHLKNIQIL